MAVNPTQRQLEELAKRARGPTDGPLVMVNLNRYRERADYDGDPPGGDASDVSGREAYERYGAVALGVLERVGAEVLWSTRVGMTVVGEEQDRFDEVIVVRYPSAAAFLELAGDPAIAEASIHRGAGLERAVVICCEEGERPFAA